MTTSTDIPAMPAVRYASLAPLIAFILAAVFAAVPIISHVNLPLVDLPNHIARYFVMAHPDGALSQYYTIPDLAMVPNSAADLLWRLTGMQGDPVRFANTIMAFYAVNLIASVMVLSRVVHGQWTVWPAASGFIVFNAAFMWGFQNFLFTVPFAIFGLALWLHTERKSLGIRLAIFVPFGAVLFFMHLFGFMALAIAAFGRETQKLVNSGASWRQALLSSAAMALPFLLPLGWLIAVTLTGPENVAGSRTEFGPLLKVVHAFVSPVTELFFLESFSFWALGIFGFALFIVCFLTVFSKKGPRLVLDQRIKGPFIALLVAALLAPAWLNGVALVHIRLPVIVMALFFAGTGWKNISSRQAVILLLFFSTIIGIRAVEFERYAAKHDAEVADLAITLNDMPYGSRLLPLRAPGYESRERLWHIQGYAVPMRQSFVPTLFQGVHGISVKKEWIDHSHPALHAVDARRAFDPAQRADAAGYYWHDWERAFTHVLLIDEVGPDLKIPQFLTKVAQNGRFTLYRITGDQGV
ncbi:MAG: hypothetical protein WBH04_05925 [Albidovulum sp.]